MSQKVTLICPEGAFDYPIAHGTQEFYPYRADHKSDYPRDWGGPWLVDVPIEVYHHFIGRAGFAVYEPEAKSLREDLFSLDEARERLSRLYAEQPSPPQRRRLKPEK